MIYVEILSALQYLVDSVLNVVLVIALYIYCKRIILVKPDFLILCNTH